MLPDGRLPTLKSVIEYFYHLQPVNSYSVEYNGTLDLLNNWVKYNVYTLTKKTQFNLILQLIWKNRSILKNYPKGKKKDIYWKQYYEFVPANKQLFDIIASDDRIKAHEKIWKIKMTESDYQFRRNMSLVPHKYNIAVQLVTNGKRQKKESWRRKNSCRKERY